MTAYNEKQRGFMEKLLELISLVRQKYAKVNGMFAHQKQQKNRNIQYAINNSNKKNMKFLGIKKP